MPKFLLMNRIGGLEVMRLSELLVAALVAFSPSTMNAEVAFPQSRNAVAPDEVYVLEAFGDWKVECIRDENSEDLCYPTRTIKALDYGLKLEFLAWPYTLQSKGTKVDVEVAPVANIEILPLSSAEHYNDYSASITSVDDASYDGYWCQLTDDTSCLRGPELIQSGLEVLLAGRQAVVTIYDKTSTPKQYKLITEINVDLTGFAASFNRAREFNAEIHGLDLATAKIPLEMCDLYIKNAQKRISYTYDEDFDSRSTTSRESWLGPKGAGSCPSYVALAYMTPDLTPAQRSMFCLVLDNEKGSIVGFQQGEQNAYRVCKKPSRSACTRVNSTKEAALAITGFAAGTVGTAVGTTMVTGTTVVLHSSGAVILTGAAGYIAGTLGTIGTTALGVLTLPITAAVAAVSVVAVGGAVYICAE
jgi:invasion protein IalB